MATMADSRAEGFFRSESRSTPPAPPQPSHQQGKEEKPQPGQQAQQSEPESRLPGIAQTGDKIVAKSTNYSVTPGPAWIEFTNPVAQAAGTITGHIPLWGSGQMLAALRLPIACVVIKPTVTPALLAQMQKQQQQQKQQQEKQQQEKEQKQKEQQEKEQKSAQPKAASSTGQTSFQAASVAGMAAEIQGRQLFDDGLRAEYQSGISDLAADFEAEAPRLLTPEEQALTGMSPSGFPGLLPGLRQASALPAGMGVQGVTIDDTQSPAEVTVRLVGSGSVPANSRWLVFTIQGV